eukprot:COSAG05_NODE_1792_length_4082_cov_3.402963_5_plen_129_part_00
MEITRCVNTDVPIETVIGVGAFSLEEVMKIEPGFLDPDEEHVHDERITSVGITEAGDLDMDKMNGWLGTLLREKGVDIYRMKGVLSIAGQEQRFVFQVCNVCRTQPILGSVRPLMFHRVSICCLMASP